MKKFFGILILFLNLVLLNSCAKPTVVTIVKPDDDKLSCEKLASGIIEAQNFRDKALAVTGNTPQNQMRAIFFWPALATTYSNVHEALVAATGRSIHLANIMIDRDCKDTDKLLKRIQTSIRVQSLQDLANTYEKLNELYNSGGLSEREYDIERRRILGQ